MIVVIFITSLLLALIYPSFRALDNTGKSEATRFASIIRYLNDTAINRKAFYGINIDINGKSISYEGQEGKKEIVFKTFESIYVGSKGELFEGQIKISFGPYGLEEILKVIFRDSNGGLFVVSYNPYSKQVKVAEEREK